MSHTCGLPVKLAANRKKRLEIYMILHLDSLKTKLLLGKSHTTEEQKDLSLKG